MGAAEGKVCCTDAAGDNDTQQIVSTPQGAPGGPIIREVPLPDDMVEGSGKPKEVMVKSPLDAEPKDVAPVVAPSVEGGSEVGSLPAVDGTKDLIEVVLLKESETDQLCLAVRHLKSTGRLVVLQIQPGGAVERAKALL
mmetsp:Transcript_7124/g.9956  ORF Transcript_7124/g.9956 Transcript_7124/m.9956 type:complete len:139 (+) Transcript_7124:76-492(+)